MRLAAALLVLGLSGCIVLPTPEHGHLGGHGEITSESAEFIIPGLTTREEVLLNLGEPDAVLREGRLFLYTWETVGGYVISQGGGGPLPSRNVFLALFHPSGLVSKSGRADTGFVATLLDGSLPSVARAAEEWAGD